MNLNKAKADLIGEIWLFKHSLNRHRGVYPDTLDHAYELIWKAERLFGVDGFKLRSYITILRPICRDARDINEMKKFYAFYGEIIALVEKFLSEIRKTL